MRGEEGDSRKSGFGARGEASASRTSSWAARGRRAEITGHTPSARSCPLHSRCGMPSGVACGVRGRSLVAGIAIGSQSGVAPGDLARGGNRENEIRRREGPAAAAAAAP